MATVNFSVPDDVKDAFNTTFSGRNKSAIIADLMREAIERAHRKQQRHAAIEHILTRHRHAPVLTDSDIRSAREENRP